MDNMKVIAKTLEILLGDKPEKIEIGYNTPYTEEKNLIESNQRLVENEDGEAVKVAINKEMEVALKAYTDKVNKTIKDLEEKLQQSEKKFNSTFDKLKQLLEELAK